MVRRFVLSGCSGGGKSTLLAEMARRGWAVCEEPGRRVRAETARGGDGLPWRDAERFARLCIETYLADLARPGDADALYDRSLVDAVSALRRRGRMRDENAALLARHRYSDPAIMAPPWPEIHQTDAERRHGFAAAVAEYEDLREAFPAADYAVVELPRASVAERADRLEAAFVGEREGSR